MEYIIIVVEFKSTNVLLSLKQIQYNLEQKYGGTGYQTEYNSQGDVIVPETSSKFEKVAQTGKALSAMSGIQEGIAFMQQLPGLLM